MIIDRCSFIGFSLEYESHPNFALLQNTKHKICFQRTHIEAKNYYLPDVEKNICFEFVWHKLSIDDINIEQKKKLLLLGAKLVIN